MSQEPQREIEKQLREHAEKRRATAGDQLELHPATRQMLQGEVARTYGTTPPVAEKTAAKPWWSYWPVALFGSCCVLLLAVMVNSRKEEAEFAKADSVNDRMLALAPTSVQPAASAVPAATPPAAAPTVALEISPTVHNPEPVTLSASKANADRFNLDVRQAPGEPMLAEKPKTMESVKEANRDAYLSANSPPPAPTRPQTASAPAAAATTSPMLSGRAMGGSQPEPMAKSKVMAEKLAEPAVVTNSLTVSGLANADEAGMKKQAAVTVVQSNSLRMDTSSVYFAATLTDSTTEKNSQTFTQTPARSMMRRNYQSPPIPAVLESFQVQQTGDEVKIIDGDGSVYIGSMLPPETENESLADRDKDTTRSRSELQVRGGSLPAQSQAIGGFTQQSQPSRAFRATGMNRTLNQQIVIDGTFEQMPAPELRKAVREAQKAEAAKQAATPLPQLQIQGRVQVGTRQELFLNATPVNR